MPSRTTITRQLADVRAAILQHGWMVQLVAHGGCATPGCHRIDTGIPFGYTVGLTRFHGHPELIVLGACRKDTMFILNALGAMVRDGRVLRAGDVVEMAGWPLTLLCVSRPHDRLVTAQRLYRPAGGPPVPALQVVFSDRNSRWPWEPAYDRGPDDTPLLGPVPPPMAA